MKIVIQAGHQNTTTGATGAPEEQANNIRIRDRLGTVLTSRGFQVTLCDANFKGTEDYNLALALHCDMNYDGNEGGGFVDYPDPSVDFSSAESKRIKEAIESVYFTETKIRNVPGRSNPNTKFYYWWSMLTKNTPCVIVEMGESVDPHDRVLLANTDLIANALCKAICKAFNVPYDITPPTSPEPPQPPPTPPVEPSVPPVEPPPDALVVCHANLEFCNSLIQQAKGILYGKGFWWTKLSKIKTLLPKN